MKTLKNNIEKQNVNEIVSVFKKEFPYSKIKNTVTKRNGYYNVYLDCIHDSDVNKFITVMFESSCKFGIGIGIPVRIRYKKIIHKV